MLRRLLLLVIGLAFASSVWGFDDWPQWRCRNRDGISTEKGLLDHWDDVPPLVWKAEGLGDGYAGAVVAGGIVCTLGDRNGKTTVIAVRDKDGKEIWATEIDGHWIDSLSRSPCTPTIDGERIY